MRGSRKYIAACCLAAASGCTRPSSELPQAGTCPGASALPDLTDVSELPTSELVFSVNVALQAVRAAVDRSVPEQLDAARGRNIGAPGELSYRVTRGPFAFALSGSRLLASTVVSAEAEVCKRLGPICFTYGSCSPRLNVVTRVPAALTSEYTLEPATVQAEVTRPCVVAGFDATPRIRAMAEQETKRVADRINAALPDLSQHVKTGFALAQKPFPLSLGSCVQLTPRSLVQAPPNIENDQIKLRVGARGSLMLGACQPTSTAPVPLPALATEALGDRSQLRLIMPIAQAQLATALAEQLKGKSLGAAGTIERVSVRAVRGALLEVTAPMRDGACLELRTLAEPYYDAKAARLRLRRANGAAPNDALARTIESAPGVALPIAVSRLEQLLASVARLQALAPPFIAPDLKFEPARVAQIHVHPDRLLAVVEIAAQLRAELRAIPEQ